MVLQWLRHSYIAVKRFGNIFKFPLAIKMAGKLHVLIITLENVLLWKHGVAKEYKKGQFLLVSLQYITCLHYI